jgi:predicted nucleotidyltransferase
MGQGSLEREKIILNLKNFFEEKASYYKLELVFLYGSWVRGYPKKESDIDLAILFSPEIIEDTQRFLIITDISYHLQEKLKRDVNIIAILEEFTNPFLYYNVIIFGVPIFIKDYNRLLSLKLEALFTMEDFKNFAVKWQRKIADNLIRDR